MKFFPRTDWGNPTAIDSVTLTYDALGRMVEQSGGTGGVTQIVYGPSGAKLALMNGSTLKNAFVPLPAGETAVYTASGLAYYRHPDWLGSARLDTTPGRTVYAYDQHAPFGEHAFGSPKDAVFTGQNQDTANYLYDFLYREYNAPQGRWISPDPAGLAAVDPTNPQSWNRYAYVGNSPLNYIDPLGLFLGPPPPPPPPPDPIPDPPGPPLIPIPCSTQSDYGCAPPPRNPNCIYGPAGPAVCWDPNAPATPPADKGLAAKPGQGGNKQISADANGYNQCVADSPFKYNPERWTSPAPPKGRDLDMGVWPSEGVPEVPNNNLFHVDTMRRCLQMFPLAALDSNYQGIDPGSVF